MRMLGLLFLCALGVYPLLGQDEPFQYDDYKQESEEVWDIVWKDWELDKWEREPRDPAILGLEISDIQFLKVVSQLNGGSSKHFPAEGFFSLKLNIKNSSDKRKELKVSWEAGEESLRQLIDREYVFSLSPGESLQKEFYFPLNIEYALGLDSLSLSQGWMTDGDSRRIGVEDIGAGRKFYWEDPFGTREINCFFFGDLYRNNKLYLDRDQGSYLDPFGDEQEEIVVEPNDDPDSEYMMERVWFGGDMEFRPPKSKYAEGFLYMHLPLEKLPAQENIYLDARCIILECAKFETLDREKKKALMDWVAVGGVLVLNRYKNTGNSVPLGPHGMGQVLSKTIDLTSREDLMKFYRTIGEELSEYSYSSEFSTNNLGEKYKEKAPPVPLPTVVFLGGWTLFLILFWGFYGERMLKTGKKVVLASIGTIILMGGVTLAVIAVMGNGGEGKRSLVVMLLPGGQSARVTQNQISHTGFLWEKDFFVPEDTHFTSYIYRKNNRLWRSHIKINEGVMDIFEYKNFSGWEVPGEAIITNNKVRNAFNHNSWTTQFFSRKINYLGEVFHLESSKEGVPVIGSSLPVDLYALFHIDDQGRIWTARHLKSGEKTLLKPFSAGWLCRMAIGLNKIPHGGFMARGSNIKGVQIETLPTIKWEEEIEFKGMIRK